MAQARIIDKYNEVMLVIEKDTIEKLNKAGDIVRDSAKEECPVRKGKGGGKLKKSIKVQRLPKERAVKIIVGSKKAWYAHLVLFGSIVSGIRFTRGRGPHVFKKHSTGVMRPNNFMLRALNKNQAKLVALFGKPITMVEK